MMKRVSDSYTEQIQILTQANMNGYGRLFGGQLLTWVDVVAGVVAPPPPSTTCNSAARPGPTTPFFL